MACIRKRKYKNGFRYFLDYYDNMGIRQREVMVSGTSKKKARERLREIEDQLEKGLYVPNKKIPTFKKTAENWLEFKKPNLRASTFYCYEGHTKTTSKTLTHSKSTESPQR